MMVGYILLLVFSAWIIAFGLTLVAARLSYLLAKPLLAPLGTIALGVSLCLWFAVDAPLWLMAAILSLALLPRVILRLPSSLPYLLLLSTVPLIAAPLLGAPLGFAIDGALVAAAVMGERYAA